ncbi:bL17 family ribosomal protein [Planctomicrobium sp. SH668]|uniref:bL17 family ribosomal protein n=1 Tax=Planctomicrobium sp. SH668 TaxID=3448126 RepID=UPI003F5BD02E
MRHRVKGRRLGRSGSHRKAMYMNMAASLIKTVSFDKDAVGAPKEEGRIVTTVPKAKELRPFVEKLVTLAKKALPFEEKAKEFATSAERNSAEWKAWRDSDQWSKWVAARAPAVNARRRAFSFLRDMKAVDILFDVIAPKYADRNGGYLRILRLATPRLGDAGERAMVAFVGENDRVKVRRSAPSVVSETANV